MMDLSLAWTGAEVSGPEAFAVDLSESERAAIVAAGRRLAWRTTSAHAGLPPIRWIFCF